MTDKKTEALKLALEALRQIDEAMPFPVAKFAQAAIREALEEQPSNPIRWDSNAVDMTGAMATLPKTGSESVVDYKPVISDIGADANIAGIPGTYYGIVLKGTGKITVTNGVQRKPWVGLTEEDIEAAMPGGIYDCLADPWDCGVGDGDYMRSIKNDVVRIVRAIEAKLKEKNHG